MNFWPMFGAFLVATAVVIFGLSINGKSEAAGGHDDHAHGHDDHGHGAHH